MPKAHGPTGPMGHEGAAALYIFVSAHVLFRKTDIHPRFREACVSGTLNRDGVPYAPPISTRPAKWP